MYSPQSQAVWFPCAAWEPILDAVHPVQIAASCRVLPGTGCGASRTAFPCGAWERGISIRRRSCCVASTVGLKPDHLPAKKPCNMGKVLIFREKGQAMLEGDGADPDVVGGDRSSLLSQVEEDGTVLLGGFFIDGIQRYSGRI